MWRRRRKNQRASLNSAGRRRGRREGGGKSRHVQTFSTMRATIFACLVLAVSVVVGLPEEEEEDVVEDPQYGEDVGDGDGDGDDDDGGPGREAKQFWPVLHAG